MSSEFTRQYSPPRSVSSLATSYYRQSSRNAGGLGASSSNNLPDAHDLTAIKADLESILPHTEQRLKELHRDFNHLEKDIKVRDSGGGSKKSNTSSGKNVQAMLEKMRIKEETSLSDDSSDILYTSNPLAGSDGVGRRRRQEEMSTSDDESSQDHPNRSTSPQHHVKMKKLSNTPKSPQSASPPVKPHTHAAKQIPKPMKKKKANNNQNRAQFNNTAPSSHAGSGKQPKDKPAPQQGSTPKTNSSDVDFVRVKPKDQVPILTFWAAVEPYFRPLTEDDRKFLIEKHDHVKPFLIPPLGRHYQEQWAEQEEALQKSLSSDTSLTGTRSRQGSHDSTTPLDTGTGQPLTVSNAPTESLRYLRPGMPITDEHLLTQDLSCGSLSERLLSSLVLEDIADASILKALAVEQDDDAMDVDTDSAHINPSGGRTIVELASEPPDTIVDFEERLKRELRYAGLFSDDDIDWNAREDDEICAELRRLGRELKEQAQINTFRKKQLLEVVDQQLQYEQYRHVLDMLDSQVEQCYLKRFRIQKSKKRKSASATKATLSENAINAMEKRRTWIQALEPIFKDKNVVMPVKSIYETEEQDTVEHAQSAL